MANVDVIQSRERAYRQLYADIMGCSLSYAQVRALKDLLDKCADPETKPVKED
jgi:hypothetical protein